jgi:hypothetical protein
VEIQYLGKNSIFKQKAIFPLECVFGKRGNAAFLLPRPFPFMSAKIPHLIFSSLAA